MKSNVLLGNFRWIDAIEKGTVNIDNNVSCSQCVHIIAALNVKTLSGVKLRSNVVVAENSVVTSDIPSNLVIDGIPACSFKKHICKFS
ncbi:hypothetical protein D5078_19470 [Pectobacterium carotovorum]|nr:hypothetical protein D5078_19470 [Pectobacterium carotovorum]